MKIMPASKKYYGKRVFKKYSTIYARVLLLALEMSENQQKILLDVAQKILDKRRKIRKNCLALTHYNIENKEYISFILDLNKFGAYIETDEYFLAGRYIDLSFVDPFSGKKIFTTSKIVWSNPGAMGVQFASFQR
jgi:Tfp pilus assembly protein PilZ